MNINPQECSSLLDALVSDGAIPADMAREWEALSPRSMYQHIIADGRFDEEHLASRVADYLGIPYLSADDASVTAEARELMARLESAEPPVIPLVCERGGAVIGVSDPFDLDLSDQLSSLIGLPVQICLLSQSTITALRERHAGQVSRLRHVGEGFRTAAVGVVGVSSNRDVDENSAPVVKLVNTLLREAVAKRASDIHVESFTGATMLRYRIDGVLQPAMDPIDADLQHALISRIKVMADLDITERRIPQDGRFQMIVEGESVDFRVSILPSIDSEDAVLRVLDRRNVVGDVCGLNLASLGFEPEDMSLLRHGLNRPSGMVIVTGPTGSGKTTTLYASLNEMASPEFKTITIEDPIEYRLRGILQIPVNEKKGLTFAKGLRSTLRHDPDRIMVGEVRDRETAEIAVHCAMTGHLLLTTLHANSALDVLQRMRHLGLPLESFVTTLSCVASQRLLRKLCQACGKVKQPEEKLLQELGGSEGYSDARWVEAAGCDACHSTGYSGRTVVAEILLFDDALQECVLRGATGSELLSAAKANGFVSIRERALEKAAAGITSLHEVKRVLGVL